ncbi:hypothetical protein TNCV_93841 [Trichonephila clavipes]|nr:hypothetical protein TNCV_93841 [Trichonephila clavipes]
MVKITWYGAKSPRVAEQCDVNVHSLSSNSDIYTILATKSHGHKLMPVSWSLGATEEPQCPLNLSKLKVLTLVWFKVTDSIGNSLRVVLEGSVDKK